jgi:hypothetical protein
MISPDIRKKAKLSLFATAILQHTINLTSATKQAK